MVFSVGENFADVQSSPQAAPELEYSSSKRIVRNDIFMFNPI